MTLTAASTGFSVFLLCLTGIHSQSWGVEFTSKDICVFEGSTVEMSCIYTYPPRINDQETVVQRTFWFINLRNKEPLDLREDPNYAGRISYHFSGENCSLKIWDLKLNDSAEYKFRLETNQPDGSFTSSAGVSLTVTALQVKIQTKSECKTLSCLWLEMLCHSSCLPPHSSYVWYKNGGEIPHKTQQKYSDYFYSEDSVSCAVKGYESFHSPVVCGFGSQCHKVSYSARSICAFRGSSVTISCSLQKFHSSSDFWIRVHGQQKINQDSRENRLQVRTDQTQSSLTISDLTESDSDEYRFKSPWWNNDLPGTTLTVVDPHVEVIWSSSGQELVCLSSCFPLHRFPFMWFKNGEEVQGETSSSYRKPVSPEDTYSCSYEGQRSPEVYAPKSVSVSMDLTEILEGSSVILTCSCDAKPAAKFRWYENNQTLLLEGPHLILESVNRSDSRKYRCVAENELGETTSEYVFINVEYPPETSTVSVNPSAEILEGSSVTLTCSSDANPAANYTWFKEDEDSPKASGPNWTIRDFRAELSGFYYCKAENRRGRLQSSLHLIETETTSWKSFAAATITFAVLLFVFLPICIWIKKNWRATEQRDVGPENRTQLNTSPDINNPSAEAAEDQNVLIYSSIHFSENHTDCLYSNIRRNPKLRQNKEDDGVEYSAAVFNRPTKVKRTAGTENTEDSALYSTVNKSVRRKTQVS
ncbi:hypothetical protein OJAV_G00010550 [Oryzias javanicus]|uniref:Ig-like domain-containing protein n=1 Tax=Oryzias javanicus TaxID=123683 RepID=A0A437DNP9_ORYJA|nr:hypothetical protein OJAV_G00010550 [Oryzias javanicus]